MRLLLAALLGAVAMFTWEFVAHMFTPLGEAGISYLPNESTVSAALASAVGDRHGLYMFPTGGLTKESSGEEKQQGMERIMEEMKTNPSGLVLYKPAGTTFNFAKNLGVQFVTDFVKTFLAVWLLARTRLATFPGRVGFVVVVGVLAAVATNIPHWNWYGFPTGFTLANVIMEILGFFFAGLAIALVFKPAVTTP
ncbi:MAG: hypothetical protein H0V56_12970 [Chthoniobacterales bacterium]|nr:hypothetical protein [Chthoniobacterales bacterium]